ncbi:MAG: Hsp20/alpha crystallin family protein [Candidatus Moranbacteria bacterium]|nr:Hsp20/alpha crystallin family protein [Candidatus Moranbacteria bacterium]
MKNYLVRRDLGSLFDEVFDNFFQPAVYDKFSCTGMKTDIQEFEDRYELAVEIPGFTKEDIALDLKNGYLTVSANKQEKEENKEKEGRYLRKERSFTCNRTYYVGEVKIESIKAKYDNGIFEQSFFFEIGIQSSDIVVERFCRFQIIFHVALKLPFSKFSTA